MNCSLLYNPGAPHHGGDGCLKPAEFPTWRGRTLFFPCNLCIFPLPGGIGRDKGRKLHTPWELSPPPQLVVALELLCCRRNQRPDIQCCLHVWDAPSHTSSSLYTRLGGVEGQSRFPSAACPNLVVLVACCVLSFWKSSERCSAGAPPRPQLPQRKRTGS